MGLALAEEDSLRLVGERSTFSDRIDSIPLARLGFVSIEFEGLLSEH